MAEIEVLGGGIFGLSVAFACQKRGANVRLIEKRSIGAGASGGVVGALAPHTPDNWNAKKQFQYESLIATQDFWAEVDGLSGLLSGYGRIGRLVVVDDARALELALERQATAHKFWHGIADWHVIPDDSFPGWSPASPTGFLTHDTLSARIAPRQACDSLAQAFCAIGGKIICGETKGTGADAIVLATGFEGLLELSDEIGKPVGKGVKGQGLLLQHATTSLPQLFAGGVHFVPHDNGTVAVGSTTELEWDDDVAVDEQLELLYDRALAICPALQGAKILQRWAGVRPRGKRRAPMLGPHPTRPDVFIANGGFKIGFGVSVQVGKVMADLILDGVNNIPDSFTVQANLA